MNRTILVLLVVAILLFLYLRSNLGMQQAVLPFLSYHSGVGISAEQAYLNWRFTLIARNLKVKIPAVGGKVGGTLFVKNLELRRESGTYVGKAEDSRFHLPAWPDGGTQGSLRDLVNSLPESKWEFHRIRFELPPAPSAGLGAQTIRADSLRVEKNPGHLSISSGPTIQISDAAPRWQLLNGAKSSLRINYFTGETSGRMVGRFSLLNRFADAESEEFEVLDLLSNFDISAEQGGTLNLTLKGRSQELLDVKSTIKRNKEQFDIKINAVGPKLEFLLKSEDTSVRINEWRSTLTLALDHEFEDLACTGKFNFPGITFALPESDGKYLPKISMTGDLEVEREDHAYSWEVAGNLKKGDQTLLNFDSVYGSAKTERNPIKLNIPEIALKHLQPYLSPFGISLPDAIVAGSIGIAPSPSADDVFLLKSTLDMRRVRGLKHVPEEIEADCSVHLEARIDRWQTALVTRLDVVGTLNQQEDTSIADFRLELMKDTLTPVFPKQWRLQQTPISVGFNARLSPGEEEEDDQNIRLSGKLDVEFGKESKCWVSLRGTRKRLVFLRVSANAALTENWKLRNLDVSAFEFNKAGNDSLRIILGDNAPSAELLQGGAIIAQTDDESGYRFTASLKTRDLVFPQLFPAWLTLSSDLQLNGSLGADHENFTLIDCRASADLGFRDDPEQNGRIAIAFDEPLTLHRTEKSWQIPSESRISAEVDVPLRLISRLNRTTVAADGERLVLNGSLDVGSEAGPGYSGQFQAQASLGDFDLLNFKAQTGFSHEGKLQSIELEDCVVRCPPKLAQAFSPRFPHWQEATVSGTYADQDFDLSIGLKKLMNLGSLPDWTSCAGDLRLAGRYKGRNAYEFTTCDLSLLGMEPKSPETNIQVRGKLKRPLHMIIDATSLSMPDEGSGVRLNVVATPGFLARIAEQKVLDKTGLGLAFDWTFKEVDDKIESQLIASGTLADRKILGLNTHVTHDFLFRPQSLALNRLALAYHPAFMKLFLPAADWASWKELVVSGTMKYEEDDLVFNSKVKLDGLRGMEYLPSGLEASISSELGGHWSPTSGILRVQNLTVDATGIQQGRAEFGVVGKIEEPLQLTINDRPSLLETSSGKLSLQLTAPLQWVAKQYDINGGVPKAKSEVTGTLVLEPARNGVHGARLDLLGSLEGLKTVSCSGKIDVNSQFRVDSSDLNWELFWHKGMREFFAALPKWEKLTVASQSNRRDNQHQLRVEGKVTNATGIKRLPDDLSMSGEFAFAGGYRLRDRSFNAESFTLDCGSVEDGLLSVKAKLVRSLGIKLRHPLKPVAGADSAFEFNGVISDRLLARLSQAKLDPGKAGSSTFSGKLGVRELSGRYWLDSELVCTRESADLVKAELAGVLEPDGTISSFDLIELDGRNLSSLTHIFPRLGDFRMGNVTGSGKIRRGQEETKLRGQFRISELATNEDTPYAHLGHDLKLEFGGILGKETLTVSEFIVKDEVSDTRAQMPAASLKIQLRQATTMPLRLKNNSTKLMFEVFGGTQGMSFLPAQLVERDVMVLLGTAEVQLREKGIRSALDLKLRTRPKGGGAEKKKALIHLVGTLANDWRLRLDSAEIEKLVLAEHPDLKRLLGLEKASWEQARFSGALTPSDTTLDLNFEANIDKLAGLPSMPEWLTVSLSSNGICRFASRTECSLPQLELKFTPVDKSTGKAMGAFSVNVTKELKVKACGLSTVATRVEGQLAPLLLHRVFGQMPPDDLKPVTCKGRVVWKGESAVSLHGSFLYQDKSFLTVKNLEWSPQDVTLELSSGRIPAQVVAACFPDWSQFELRDSRVSLRLKPAEKDVTVFEHPLIYVTVAAREFRHRSGLFEKGDLRLEGHADVKRTGGDFSFADAPFAVKWNEDDAFTAIFSAEMFGEQYKLRMKNGVVEIPILFSMLTRFAMPLEHEARGGKIQLHAKLSGEGRDCVFNALSQLDGAEFGRRDGKLLMDSFGWRLSLSGKRTEQKTEFSLTSQGPERRNFVNGNFVWMAGQALPTRISVNGRSPDFSRFWTVFQPSRLWVNRMQQPKESEPEETKNSTAIPSLQDERIAWLPSMEALRAFRADYSVFINDLRFGPNEFSDIKISGSAAKGIGAIKNCKIELNDGWIEAGGEYRIDNDGVRAKFGMDCRKVKTKPWFAGATDADENVQGRVSCALEVEGQGKTPLAMLKNASGEGELKIEDLCYFEDPEATAKGAEIGAPWLGKMEFDVATADLVFEDGWLRTEDFEMEREDFELTADVRVRMDGFTQIQNTKLHIPTTIKLKIGAKRLSKLFGMDDWKKERSGYETVALPFSLAWNGVRWTVGVVDDMTFQFFAKSSFGDRVLRMLGLGRSVDKENGD